MLPAGSMAKHEKQKKFGAGGGADTNPGTPEDTESATRQHLTQHGTSVTIYDST